MIIHPLAVPLCAIGESMDVELPKKGLKLDPRVNHPPHIKFSIEYHDDGITATLTRIDDGDDPHNAGDSFTMRAYDPETETVPDFTSTVYLYMGLDGEHAPRDTTLIIIHPSVKMIKRFAFYTCKKLRRVIMNENVEAIGWNAFSYCYSLDAVFLPSSIKEIQFRAFESCTNLRILSVPQTINIDKIGLRIIDECHTFFRITQISPYGRGHNRENNNQVNQAIIDINGNLPPLHQACLNTNVSTQSITQCITAHGTVAAYNVDYGDGMTPLHILALNPHADSSSIVTCFEANMGAVLEPYSEGGNSHFPSALIGKTPLDYLAEYDVESHLSIVVALCRHREAHLATSSSVTSIAW